MEKKKIKIEIKKKITGNVIFEYEKESNTVKDTVVEAVKNGAYLRDAYLRDADLRGAYLRGAGLRGAYLRGAKNVPFIPFSCPSDGSFVGWKKVKDGDYTYLVKLQIPEDAKRSSAMGTKCRCSKAVVLSVMDVDNDYKEVEKCVNVSYEQKTLYEVGKEVFPDSFDDDRWNECSHGIHFFINRQEAEEYNV